MSTAVTKTVLKLALRLAERGDAEGAAEALRGVLAMAATADDEPRAADLRAVKKKTLSRALECTTRHIDHLEERGRIPRDAVLGEGAGKRYLIAAVFAALGRVAPAAIVDPIVEEGRAYARRKDKLRLVGGSR
jgi:hypothetical protein